VSCWASSRLYLNHWHAFYEILSRLWVAGHLPGSVWIIDMSSMKSCPGCELLGIFQALFESLTCLLWNPVQTVSCWASPRLYLNHWHTFYEILSSMWVAGHLPGSIWITDMPSMKSCPACEFLGTSQAPFESLTCLLWNPVQHVSCWARSIWITDMPSMKSCPGCELLGISQAPFESLTCLLWNPVQAVSCCAPPRLHLNHWHAFYKILSSMWVAVHLLGSIWITDMPSMKSCPVCELLCTS